MRILRSDIFENLMMALATLRANKLRSFLTVFGVVIGIITVMLIASIISGIDVSVSRVVRHSLDLYQQVQPGHSHRPAVTRRADA